MLRTLPEWPKSVGLRQLNSGGQHFDFLHGFCSRIYLQEKQKRANFNCSEFDTFRADGFAHHGLQQLVGRQHAVQACMDNSGGFRQLSFWQNLDLFWNFFHDNVFSVSSGTHKSWKS